MSALTQHLEPLPEAWSFGDFLTAFVMWSVMMAAMMLPAVTPWIRALARGQGSKDKRAWPGFLLGYLAVWTTYSALAAAIQGGLHALVIIDGTNGFATLFGAGLLLTAGIYQWTPWKRACLAHCRSPLGFFLTNWRSGRARFFNMGFQHGLFCVGCCWALMLLSLVAGTMNLWWMAMVTIFVFIDHTTQLGQWLGRSAGAALMIWGGWVLASYWR